MQDMERDLQLIPSPYRKPLRRFLWYGVPACGHPDLHALLCGDRYPLHDGNPAMMIISGFLDAHARSIDIAHGHLGLVLRWQYEGGLEGRNK